MIQERLDRLAAENAAEGAHDRRMGWLRLGTWVLCGISAGYTILFVDFKDHDGNEYEHVFSPLRRWYRRKMDSFLGINRQISTPNDVDNLVQAKEGSVEQNNLIHDEEGR